jgi:hypothetical protein
MRWYVYLVKWFCALSGPAYFTKFRLVGATLYEERRMDGQVGSLYSLSERMSHKGTEKKIGSNQRYRPVAANDRVIVSS